MGMIKQEGARCQGGTLQAPEEQEQDAATSPSAAADIEVVATVTAVGSPPAPRMRCHSPPSLAAMAHQDSSFTKKEEY